MAKDAADELGIVPIFFIEHSGETLDGDMVAVLVEELEVIARMLLTRFLDTDDVTFLDPLGQHKVVGLTRENLVGTALEHTYHGNPVFTVVAEADDFGLQFLGTLGGLALGKLGIVLAGLALGDEDTVARAFAVDGAALAARLPGGHVDGAYYFLGSFLGDVDGDADRMVHPFLDGTLHLDLVHPVDVGRSGLKVGRLLNQCVKFVVVERIDLFHGVSLVDFQPIDKLGMQHVVFLEVVAALVLDDFVIGRILVVGVDFLATFVADQEDWLDARSGLGANADSTCGGDGEQRDCHAPWP